MQKLLKEKAFQIRRMALEDNPWRTKTPNGMKGKELKTTSTKK